MIRYELVAYDPDKRNGDGEIPLVSWREVVRCRDCKWCMAYAKATYCDRFAHELPEATLDGFCAWGKRSKTEQEGV